VKKQPTLRERALRLLARREHSRAELARKLQADLQPDDDLERSSTISQVASSFPTSATRNLALTRFRAGSVQHALRTSFEQRASTRRSPSTHPMQRA
jgi:hypothetical protein